HGVGVGAQGRPEMRPREPPQGRLVAGQQIAQRRPVALADALQQVRELVGWRHGWPSPGWVVYLRRAATGKPLRGGTFCRVPAAVRPRCCANDARTHFAVATNHGNRPVLRFRPTAGAPRGIVGRCGCVTMWPRDDTLRLRGLDMTGPSERP